MARGAQDARGSAFSDHQKHRLGNSSEVQWLGLGAFPAEDQVQSLAGELRSRMPQGRTTKKSTGWPTCPQDTNTTLVPPCPGPICPEREGKAQRWGERGQQAPTMSLKTASPSPDLQSGSQMPKSTPAFSFELTVITITKHKTNVTVTTIMVMNEEPRTSGNARILRIVIQNGAWG